MQRILNYEQLIPHGNIAGRKVVLDILEEGLQAADPYNNTIRLFNIQNKKLIIGSQKDFIPEGDPQSHEEIIDLKKINRIFVFGAAKGVQRIAKAIEDVLGDHLTGGHVIDKKGADIELKKIEVSLGSHPTPDEDCVRGCKRIISMTKDLTEKDLVFTIAGNGVSSLLTLPIDGVTLDEVRQVTYMMQIERGVPTQDLNFIRNHIDQMKGGRFSRFIRPAKTIHLIAHGFDYDYLINKNDWLHNLPDSTHFEGAIEILKKWHVYDQTPDSIKTHLLKADPSEETVKADEFLRYPFRVFILMPKKFGVIPMVEKKIKKLGYKSYFLCNWLQAEAREAGIVLASIAKTIDEVSNPFSPPCVLLSQGELLVTVGKQKGIGGRNQELVLSGAIQIAGNKNIVIGSVDTDGTDGPGTQYYGDNSLPTLAGGIVDGFTGLEAKENNINIYNELMKHNTTPVLLKLNSGIITTKNISLNDLTAILISKP